MRYLNCGSIFTAFLVVRICLPTTATCAEHPWQVGLASVCITPEEPVWMQGYAEKNRYRPFDGVLSDLYAGAMAIGSAGGEPAVLIVADLCVLREPEEAALSKVIMARTGLQRKQILLNWSHTHSAPILGSSEFPRYPIPQDDLKKTEAYTALLWNKLADVAATALADMKPARLSFGQGKVDFVQNRRAFREDGTYRGMAANPDRYVDRNVPVLRIDDLGGRPRAIVFGCACHAVTLGGSSIQLSADYPGAAREAIGQQFPGVQTLFVQGCGADANPHPRATPDQVEWVNRHGQALAAEVCRVATGQLQPVAGPLRVEFDWVDLPLQPVPPAEELEELAKGPFWRSLNANRILEAQQRGETIPTTYRCPLALWQFGDDLALVAIAGEVVSDYVPLVAKTIEAESLAQKHREGLPRGDDGGFGNRSDIGSERLWVTGYSNQVFGYFPSAKVLEEGGYETVGIVGGQIGWFSPDSQNILLDAVRRLYRKKLPVDVAPR